jgi:hypothetical protein
VLFGTGGVDGDEGKVRHGTKFARLRW